MGYSGQGSRHKQIPSAKPSDVFTAIRASTMSPVRFPKAIWAENSRWLSPPHQAIAAPSSGHEMRYEKNDLRNIDQPKKLRGARTKESLGRWQFGCRNQQPQGDSDGRLP